MRITALHIQTLQRFLINFNTFPYLCNRNSPAQFINFNIPNFLSIILMMYFYVYKDVTRIQFHTVCCAYDNVLFLSRKKGYVIQRLYWISIQAIVQWRSGGEGHTAKRTVIVIHHLVTHESILTYDLEYELVFTLFRPRTQKLQAF